MKNQPNFPRFRVLWACLLFLGAWACAPHRPWDRSVPATARARWQRGEAMFLSLGKKIKPFEDGADAQEPEVRDAAEAALLCLTAHARLPPDPRRQNRLAGWLRTWGFVHAARGLGISPPVMPPSEFRLRRRDWSGLAKSYPLGDALKMASDEELGRLALRWAGSASGAAGVWALELARRHRTGGLDCEAWMRIARSAVRTHSERVLPELWPILRQVCSLEQLARPVKTGEALPEWVRLYEADAPFSARIQACLGAGVRLDARSLRDSLRNDPRLDLAELAVGFLCSGEGFLDFADQNSALEALHLHFLGKTQEALRFLAERSPENDFAGRLEAGRLALHFRDDEAAIGHLRWAAALAPDPLSRARALGLLERTHLAQEETGEAWILLQERFRLDPRHAARELWLSGQWPALVFLSGRAPLPWRDEAARALQRFVDCHPGETPDGSHPLVVSWRRRMGSESLRRVWPAAGRPSDGCSPPAPALRPDAPAPRPVHVWRGDFASDLARLLARESTPSAWEAFYARHVHDPRLLAVAELETIFFPGSFEHARAAARAFAWKNEVQRAVALLEDAVRFVPEPADAWRDSAWLLLEAGYRHEAAAFMQRRHAWLTAFSGPAEASRSDWRLEAVAETVDFLRKAGFPAEAELRLRTLLRDAGSGDSLRMARTAEWLARRHPEWFTPASLLRVTDNPLFFLQWAAFRPDARREVAHILSQLALVLPESPEIAWLSCALTEEEAACLAAHARDVAGPIRLEMALDLLDRAEGMDTRSLPPDARLALAAARRRARAHSAWRFVERELASMRE